jgi:hypothetical protein
MNEQWMNEHDKWMSNEMINEWMVVVIQFDRYISLILWKGSDNYVPLKLPKKVLI